MQDPDYGIIQQILSGNNAVYANLIDRYKYKGFALAKGMLKNREDAEEVLQDAFIRAFRSLNKFEWQSSFSTWFYRILVNQCKTKLRSRKKYFELSINDSESEYFLNIPIQEKNIDFQFDNKELRNIILDSIEKLDPIYSCITTLFYIQELSYTEIVEVTDLPLGTVKTRLNRARLMLRQSLIKHDDIKEEIKIYQSKPFFAKELVL